MRGNQRPLAPTPCRIDTSVITGFLASLVAKLVFADARMLSLFFELRQFSTRPNPTLDRMDGTRRTDSNSRRMSSANFSKRRFQLLRRLVSNCCCCFQCYPQPIAAAFEFDVTSHSEHRRQLEDFQWRALPRCVGTLAGICEPVLKVARLVMP